MPDVRGWVEAPGGSGHSRESGEDGLGGGGGLSVTPLGYIELKEGKSRFRRIVTPVGRQLLLAGGLLAVVSLARRVLD